MRYAWIECQGDQFAVSRMWRVLRVSRTGPARQRNNDKLGAQFRVIHAENDRSYGPITAIERRGA